MTTARGELKAAARQLEEHGWKQGAYGNYSQGACCAAGAVLKVEERQRGMWVAAEELRDFDSLPGKAIKRLSKFLRQRGLAARKVPTLQDHHDVVVKWNDADGRTKLEVIQALRGASKKRSKW